MPGVGPGAMRHVIKFMRRSAVVDDFGEEKNEWLLHAKVRAAVMPLQGSEDFEAQQDTGRVLTKFVLRPIDGIKLGIHIQWAGRWYDIRAVLPPVGIGRELEVLADELVEVPPGAPA